MLSLRFTRNIADRCEALGRSRGGLGTKLVGVCDAAGRLLDFLLVPGQAHELAPSLTLLRRLPGTPSWVVADRACDAAGFRAEMLRSPTTMVNEGRRSSPGGYVSPRKQVEAFTTERRRFPAVPYLDHDATTLPGPGRCRGSFVAGSHPRMPSGLPRMLDVVQDLLVGGNSRQF